MDALEAELDIPAEIRRFNVDEFFRMLRLGILSREEHLELIEGLILHKAHVTNLHAASVDNLVELFVQHVRAYAITHVKGEIILGTNSVVRPDVSLLKRRSDYYALAVPVPDDVLLIVQLSEASPKQDRGARADLYAHAGVAELWVVNLSAETVMVLAQPSSNDYQSARTFQGNETIASTSIPDLILRVDEIML